MSKTELTSANASDTVGILNKGKEGIYVSANSPSSPLLSLQSSHPDFKEIQRPSQPFILYPLYHHHSHNKSNYSILQQKPVCQHAISSNHGPWGLQPHLISHSRSRRLQPRRQSQRHQQTQQPLQLDRPLCPCCRRRQRWLQLESSTPTHKSSSKLGLDAGHLAGITVWHHLRRLMDYCFDITHSLLALGGVPSGLTST
jgi:hypothetical protein